MIGDRGDACRKIVDGKGWPLEHGRRGRHKDGGKDRKSGGAAEAVREAAVSAGGARAVRRLREARGRPGEG